MARVCERMHWTYAEYKATPAYELMMTLAIWRGESQAEAMMKAAKV